MSASAVCVRMRGGVWLNAFALCVCRPCASSHSRRQRVYSDQTHWKKIMPKPSTDSSFSGGMSSRLPRPIPPGSSIACEPELLSSSVKSSGEYKKPNVRRLEAQILSQAAAVCSWQGSAAGDGLLVSRCQNECTAHDRLPHRPPSVSIAAACRGRGFAPKIMKS